MHAVAGEQMARAQDHQTDDRNHGGRPQDSSLHHFPSDF
jgi:hypothetical protein